MKYSYFQIPTHKHEAERQSLTSPQSAESSRAPFSRLFTEFPLLLRLILSTYGDISRLIWIHT